MIDRHAERNYGVDLLRIISMIMIVVLHVIGHGGILDSVKAVTVNYAVVWVVELLAYCSVDVYAIISGYVGYGKKQKFRNLFYLLFQVWFYTCIITFVYFLINRSSVPAKTALKALFPFAFNVYWYFTAYFCMFFFTPFLNLMVEKFSRKTIERLLLFLFIIFSLMPTLFMYDFSMTNGGRSALWLSIMYLVGLYIRRYGELFTSKGWKLFAGYIVCVLTVWLFKIGVEAIMARLSGEPKYGDYLIGYTSPLVISAAIFFVRFFANMRCKTGIVECVTLFSPLTFGVYLLHEEPLIRKSFIEGKFSWIGNLSPLAIPFAVIGIAVCIWFVCSIIDKGRLFLFDLLRIKTLCARLESKTTEFFSYFQSDEENY